MQLVNGPENNRFGGGFTETYMHPAVVAVLIVAIIMVFVLPRKYIVVPILLAVFLTPFGQQVYVAGAHLFVGRILILCGWIRILIRSESTPVASGGLNRLDRVFLCWASFRAIGGTLEFLQMQAFINQVAFLWDSIGAYFLLRFLVRDEEDVIRLVKTLTGIIALLAVTMIGERLFTLGVNVFGYFGGHLIPQVRDGAISCRWFFPGTNSRRNFCGNHYLLVLMALPACEKAGRCWYRRSGHNGGDVCLKHSAHGIGGSGAGDCFLATSKDMRAIRW